MKPTSSKNGFNPPFLLDAEKRIDSAILEVRPASAAALTPSADQSDHVPELDGLRGVAALCAVFYHYLFGPALAIPSVAALDTFLEATPIPLDTFCILSGLLIGGILLHSKDSPNY